MIKKPKVSVLLAAYNSNDTIFESLQSILMQTYPDLELILCDDGTEGFDPCEIETFVKEQNPEFSIQIVHQTTNIGTVRNLNAGLKVADGEWVILLAADDCFSSEDAVAHLVERVQADDRVWGISSMMLCDGQLKSTGQTLPQKKVTESILSGNADALYLQLCTGCCLPAGGAIYRIDLLREMGGFDETYRLVEDWPIFLKLVRRGELPTMSEENLVLHRFGGISQKNAGKHEEYQRDLIAVLREEVAPHLYLLDEKEQKRVRKFIREKEAVFELRFSGLTWLGKAGWAIRHMGLIARKVLCGRDGIC